MIDIKDLFELCLGFACGFVLAVIVFIWISCLYTKRRKHKRKAVEAQKFQKKSNQKNQNKKVKIDTYVKAVTTLVLAHGLIMVSMSYVLAFFEKDAVVDVSVTLITEIVAPLCLYMGTNCIMNIFEKNELTFSKPIHMQQVREAWDKVHDDMEDETGDNAAG